MTQTLLVTFPWTKEVFLQNLVSTVSPRHQPSTVSVLYTKLISKFKP